MSAAVQSGIPTLVLTASRADDAMAASIPAGVAGILAKPIDPHALCELSRDLVAESKSGGFSASTLDASEEDPAVLSFMTERRPRVARDAMNALSAAPGLSRAEVHRLVGRLSMYGLHDSAEALRDAEESMAIGRSAADSSVSESIIRARVGLEEFVARS
jgi:CheY-like chemotaxis protein